MLLYITSSDYVNQFDRVLTENQVVKKMVGEYVLKELLLKDLKSLGHFEKILIDLSACLDTEEEFLDALESFAAISASTLIIYAPMLQVGSRLIKELIGREIYNILIEKDYERFQEEAKKALTIGYSREDAIRLLGEAIRKDEPRGRQTGFSFVCKGKQITFTGNGVSVGTTAAALQLAYNFTQKSAKVAVVFFNKDEKLKDIAQYYGLKERKELFYEKENLFLLSSSVPISDELESCNFIILDIGAFSEEKRSVLGRSVKNFVVTYSKPWDFRKLEEMRLDRQEAIYLFRAAEEEKRANIRRQMGKEEIYFLDYAPSYFDEKANDAIYFQALSDYVVKL